MVEIMETFQGRLGMSEDKPTVDATEKQKMTDTPTGRLRYLKHQNGLETILQQEFVIGHEGPRYWENVPTVTTKPSSLFGRRCQ